MCPALRFRVLCDTCVYSDQCPLELRRLRPSPSTSPHAGGPVRAVAGGVWGRVAGQTLSHEPAAGVCVFDRPGACRVGSTRMRCVRSLGDRGAREWRGCVQYFSTITSACPRSCPQLPTTPTIVARAPRSPRPKHCSSMPSIMDMTQDWPASAAAPPTALT